MKFKSALFIGVSLSTLLVTGCAVRLPGASMTFDPAGQLERHGDGRYYDRGGRGYDYHEGRYYDDDGRPYRGGDFCPPGQAKKGRC